jgi:hypothetical protein
MYDVCIVHIAAVVFAAFYDFAPVVYLDGVVDAYYLRYLRADAHAPVAERLDKLRKQLHHVRVVNKSREHAQQFFVVDVVKVFREVYLQHIAVTPVTPVKLFQMRLQSFARELYPLALDARAVVVYQMFPRQRRKDIVA